MTFAVTARATNAVNTCQVTGATTVTVPVADTTSVDAPATVLPLPPGVSRFQPIDPCRQWGSSNVNYALAVGADNTITAAASTVDHGSVDLP